MVSRVKYVTIYIINYRTGSSNTARYDYDITQAHSFIDNCSPSIVITWQNEYIRLLHYSKHFVVWKLANQSNGRQSVFIY